MRLARAAHLSKLRHLYPVPGPIPDLVTETVHSVPTRDGASINVKVYRPAKGPPPEDGGGSALVMLYHEGGWCMGDLTDEECNARLLVRELGVVCVNVEYRYVAGFFYMFGFCNVCTYMHVQFCQQPL
jgi:acetyl esterase/lipase